MSMEAFYEVAGISRQAFHAWLRPTAKQQARTPQHLVDEMARNVRRQYLPGAGAREVCYYIRNRYETYDSMLLGLTFSQTMRQAYTERAKNKMPNLIFHSDGGKQYIETKFLDALRQRHVQSSMAESCYENAFAEAFNDILKNHILYDLDLNSFAQLKKQEHFVKKCYNHHRPHNSLHRMTPVEFEQHILTLQPCQRTLLKIKVITSKI